MSSKPSSAVTRDARPVGAARYRIAEQLPAIACALLDSRDEAIVIFGAQRETLYVNAAARAMLPPGTISPLLESRKFRDQLVARGGAVVPLRSDAKLLGEMIVVRRQSGRTLAEQERDAIHEMLGLMSGRRAAAARRLGISRTTLWRRLRAERR